MANLKISQLTATTQNTIGSFVVINNSGETTSNKSQLIDVLGLTKGTGNFSIKSADFLSQTPAVSDTDFSIAIGNAVSATTGLHQVVIGSGSFGQSENVIVIGREAHDQGPGRDNGIAIGYEAEIYQVRAVSIGKNAAGVTDCVAVGTDTRAIGNNCIAIGRAALSAGNDGIAIGQGVFCDRTDTLAIGSAVYLSGEGSIAVGARNSIGASGGDSENSLAIGHENVISGGFHRQIAIGFEADTAATGAINISSSTFRVTSPEAINIGGSGNTYGSGAVNMGIGNIRIGGFNDTIAQTPGSFNTFIGGGNNTINSVAGSGRNNVFLGMSGRSLQTGAFVNNQTHVENLRVFGAIRQNFTSFSTSGSVVVDVATMGYVELITTSGETYDISIDPAPNEIGDTVTFFITFQSGATVNFVTPGSVNWRFNPAFGTPVFSGSPESRSILVFNTWDGNDMWEVSRSMNMI